MNIEGGKVYLASQSPRRAGLLRDEGYVFEQVSPKFDDTGVMLEGIDQVMVPESLAKMKAESLRGEINTGVVICADTVLMFKGELIGKPVCAVDAEKMLNGLFDEWHEVVSGVAVMDMDTKKCLTGRDVARVFIPRPEDDVFEEYIRSGLWEGKAGGYNLGELETVWDIKVEGDRTTVIGLPMGLVKALLEAL